MFMQDDLANFSERHGLIDVELLSRAVGEDSSIRKEVVSGILSSGSSVERINVDGRVLTSSQKLSGRTGKVLLLSKILFDKS